MRGSRITARAIAVRCSATIRGELRGAEISNEPGARVSVRLETEFELDFGTSKSGGDGTARFREEARHMNQFIVHAALDMVEEVQWSSKEL